MVRALVLAMVLGAAIGCYPEPAPVPKTGTCITDLRGVINEPDGDTLDGFTKVPCQSGPGRYRVVEVFAEENPASPRPSCPPDTSVVYVRHSFELRMVTWNVCLRRE